MTCNDKQFYCEVCGYPADDPWGPGDLCPCCGGEWGYDFMDSDQSKEYREKWIATLTPEEREALKEQFKNILI